MSCNSSIILERPVAAGGDHADLARIVANTARPGVVGRGPAASIVRRRKARAAAQREPPPSLDRKSVVEGKSVAVRVDVGGARIIKKKKNTKKENKRTTNT